MNTLDSNKDLNIFFINQNEMDIINAIEIYKNHDKNFDINKKYRDQTLLLYAIKNMYPNLCYYLLEDNNIYVDIGFEEYLQNIFLLKNSNILLNILKKILNKKNIDKYGNKINSIIPCVINGIYYINIEILQLLIENGVNIYKDEILEYFVCDRHYCFGRYDIVKYLINIYDKDLLADLNIYCNNCTKRAFINNNNKVNILSYICRDSMNLYLRIHYYYNYPENIPNRINIDLHIINILEIVELIVNKLYECNYNKFNNYIDTTLKEIYQYINDTNHIYNCTINEKNSERAINFINFHNNMINILCLVKSNSKSASKIKS